MRLDAGTENERVFYSRVPDGYGANSYPRSIPNYGPAEIPPNMDARTGWTPRGMLVPRNYEGEGWDALHGRLMDVSQADRYNAAPNPFPANSVFDTPNAWHAIIPLIRLGPTTSAHPGYSLPSGPGPVMIFHPPPSFGIQTTPIYATGA